MIEIRPAGLYSDGIIIQGHAGYAEHGHDIVCASISAISQMIANETFLRSTPTAFFTRPKDRLTIYTRNDEFITDSIFMAIRYFKEMERQYPNHIKVYEEEEYE